MGRSRDRSRRKEEVEVTVQPDASAAPGSYQITVHMPRSLASTAPRRGLTNNKPAGASTPPSAPSGPEHRAPPSDAPVASVDAPPRDAPETSVRDATPTAAPSTAPVASVASA